MESKDNHHIEVQQETPFNRDLLSQVEINQSDIDSSDEDFPVPSNENEKDIKQEEIKHQDNGNPALVEEEVKEPMIIKPWKGDHCSSMFK